MTSKFIPPDPRQQMQKQPDLSLAEDIRCENCGNYTFEEVLMMKKLSAIMSPNGKEGIVPVPTFACVACGWVNKMFRPAYMQTEEAAPQEQTLTTEAEPARPKLVLED